MKNKQRDLRSLRKKVAYQKHLAQQSTVPVLCWFCKQPIDMTLVYHDRLAWTWHHLEPLNTGGHVLGPGVDAHRSCNSSYGDGSRFDPLAGKTINL